MSLLANVCQFSHFAVSGPPTQHCPPWLLLVMQDLKNMFRNAKLGRSWGGQVYFKNCRTWLFFILTIIFFNVQDYFSYSWLRQLVIFCKAAKNNSESVVVAAAALPLSNMLFASRLDQINSKLQLGYDTLAKITRYGYLKKPSVKFAVKMRQSKAPIQQIWNDVCRTTIHSNTPNYFWMY